MDAALVVTDVDIYNLEDISKPFESKFLVLLNQGNRYRVFIDDDEATARVYGLRGIERAWVYIDKQVLTLGQGTIIPGWGTNARYRMENKRFRLIGSEDYHYSPASLDESTTSINYLTGKCSITKDNASGNMKPVVVWKKLKNNRKVYYYEIGRASCRERV